MAKTIVIDTEVENKQSIKSLNELETELEQLKETIKEIPDTTSAAFKEMAAEISRAESEVKDLNKSFEGLDADAKAGELGKLAGGLGAIGTAAALAFGDNEDIEKFFQTFAQGLAITNAVKGGIESYTASVKLLRGTTILQDIATKAASLSQAAYSTVVGVTTGALKLFRLALIGTGIGAIVVLIGALVANWDSMVNAVKGGTDGFRKFADVLRLIIPPIDLILDGIDLIREKWDSIRDFLSTFLPIDDAATARMKDNTEQRIEVLKKEEAIIGKKFDFEIAKAKAAGKDTFKLEQQKRVALLNRIKAETEAIKKLAILNGEVTDEQKERIEELTTSIKDLSKEATLAVITEEKKRNDASKKASDERAKEQEIEAKRQLDLHKQLQDQLLLQIDDATEREIAKIQIDAQRKRDAITGESEKDIALKKLITENELAAIEVAEKKGEEEKLAKDKAKAEKEVTDFQVQKELELLRLENKINSLNELEDLKEEERRIALDEKEALEKEVEDEQLALELEELTLKRDNELLSEEQFNAQKEAVTLAHNSNIKKIEKESAEERIAFEEALKEAKTKAAFETVGSLISISNSLNALGEQNAGLQKALAVAQIAIDTAKGISGAVSAAASQPYPLNIVAIVSGVASVLAGIVSAKQALSKANVPSGAGGGGGVSIPALPSIPSPPTSIAAPSDDTLFGQQNLEAPDTELIGTGEGLRQAPIKAFVVEQDITNSQNTISTIESRAEIG